MKLWTFQASGFSLTSGEIDIAHSPYIDSVAGLREAYEELAQRLGLESYEIIWCYVRQDWIAGSNAGLTKWELKVPDEQILGIVDGFIWNRILSLKGAYPMSLFNQWNREVPPEAVDEHIRQQKKEYDEQLAPLDDGWWSRLFCSVDAEEACALLKHPIPKSWII